MSRETRRAFVLAAVAIAAGATAPARGDGITARVSVARDGAQADGHSARSALSPGGRYVAFNSGATNLVPGDTNAQVDVFVRDRWTGSIERVSVGRDGAQGDGLSENPAISRGGGHVAFESLATNLVPGDTNGQWDVFVHDRRTHTTRRVSLGAGGAQADNASFRPSLSADGRHVAFDSTATNLVPGDTNGAGDVFVRDRWTGRTERVSLGPGGAQGDGASGFGAVALSADGRHVAFDSNATNLVPGDTNGARDVFVHDRGTGRTVRVSLGPGGAQADHGGAEPSLSADARHVAFLSGATDLVPGDTNGTLDIFVRDRRRGITRRVSVGRNGAQGDGPSFSPAISPDGRFVAFASFATDLVPNDTNGREDGFVHDRRTGRTERVTVATGGAQADQESVTEAISADGRVVAFSSWATNLVPRDTNGLLDVFVRIRPASRRPPGG